jgi:hypothetical protein
VPEGYGTGTEVFWHGVVYRLVEYLNPQAEILRDADGHIISFDTHDLALSAGIDLILKKLTNGTE